MSEPDILAHGAAQGATARPALLDRIARRAVFAALGGITRGELILREGGIVSRFGTPGAAPRAELRVLDSAVWRQVAFGGTIGAGEAYMAGHFACDDLAALVRIFVRNRVAMSRMERGLARLRAPLNQLLHALRRNTRGGSRRNISAHYDLGNDFYARILDREAMMYSSAVYPSDTATLEEASLSKLERVCRKLDLRPGDEVLEIGTGWGGFALYAARHFGCRVTTTTISREQHQYAARRVAEAGLGDRVRVLDRDYRDLDGQFDKLVSIEMIEAVGLERVGPFLARCERLLKPGGRMLLQSITIDDRLYREAARSVDFIQRYIFPGGGLPSVAVLASALAAHTGLRISHLEEIGAHYARTLAEWRARLREQWHALRAMGYSDNFLRMFEFYFAYCEGGFLERSIGCVQILLHGPECRAEPYLP